jgi:hypothetical protein
LLRSGKTRTVRAKRKLGQELGQDQAPRRALRARSCQRTGPPEGAARRKAQSVDVVSASPFGRRGGRLSARHMRSFLSALPRIALIERAALLGASNCAQAGQRPIARAKIAHAHLAAFSTRHRAPLSPLRRAATKPGNADFMRLEAKGRSRMCKAVSQLLAGPLSGSGGSSVAARELRCDEARRRRTPSRRS